MDNFEQLKEICRQACHERNACKPGFEALMRAETIPQIMQVWKDNWEDIYRSRFCGIMIRNIVGVYADSREEFNAAGIYVNEPSEHGLVIVCNATEPVKVGGTARAYIFTPARVTATDNAQVYCRTAGSVISLHGHSSCRSEDRQTAVDAHDFSRADGEMQCRTYNASEVIITKGTLRDYGHRRIAAYGGVRVYSDTPRGIELRGQSRRYTLAEYPDPNNNDNK